MANNNNNKPLEIEIVGEKGKGGGSSAGAKEAPNTLRSKAIVRVLEVLSEGPIVGLSTGDGQSIYFDDTPIQNSDLSLNFSSVVYDTRVGLPSQPYMAGFPNVESVSTVGTNVTFAAPVVRTLSSPVVDACRITLQFPNGLSNQSTTNGNLNGSSVQLAIDRRTDATGIWETVVSPTITGKTTTPYEVDWRIEKPSGTTGTWSIRVRRITPDSAAANVRNLVNLARITEIEDVKIEYDHTAYVGIAVDAESTGGSIPARSYKVKGLIVSVPTNYDPITRVYTGQWNGTFKQAWTDNPAWVLYDLLINTRYGMGDFVTAAMVDKFSFYAAAQYNDELVDDGNGGFEPRFVFNNVISKQEDALKVLQAIAGSMRSILMYSGGLLWINQDRPSDPVKLVTKANVIDGKFTYSSTALQQRHTVARVTYNDKNNSYLPAVTTVESTTGIARYGYQPADVAAYGAVTEGQAIRFGKWILDTELNTTELVEYQTSFNQFDLLVGDVIKLYDEDYTATVGSGRIISASESELVLDRAVEIEGSATIDFLDQDGVTIHTYNIVETYGSYSVIHTTQPFALFTPTANDFIISSAVSARLFRVMNVKQDAANLVTIQAAFYDPTKYNRVEQGVSIAAPVYSVVRPDPISKPSGFASSFNSYVDPITGAHTSLTFTWTKSPEKYVTGHSVSWRKDNGTWSASKFVGIEEFTIQDAGEGTYELSVIAQASTGVSSTPAIFSYLYGFTGTNTLYPPATLQQTTTASLTFNTDSLSLVWTDDARNNTIISSTLNGWLLKIYNNSTNALLRSVPLNKDTFTYTYGYDSNIADGGPVRNIRVDAYSVDVFGNTSGTATTVIFSNPSPAVLNNIVAIGVDSGVKITYDKSTDSDFLGVLIWGSTTSGFTPSASNLVFEGDATVVSLTGLIAKTNYFYKVAAYDSFSKSYTGAGMNVSGQVSTTTTAAGIQQVSSLPGSASENDILYLSTDKKLYRYTSGAWVAVVGDILTNSITAAHLDTVNAVITGTAQLGTAVVNTAAIVDAAITNAKIESITADKIQTGTLAASQSISVGSSVVIDGAGSITTTGTNSKTVMTDGNVVSYKKVGATFYPYQQLNHMESGVATNNTAVTIPGYFISQPTVLVSPANMQFYNPTYSAQAQSIVCSSGAVTQTGAGTSVWEFTPTAQLTLASGNGSTVVGVGSGDQPTNTWTSASYTTAANCTTITPTVSLKSVRGNGVSQYYYRSIRWRVEYYDGSSWVTTDGWRTATMGAQTTSAVTDSKTFTFPSAAAWTWRIYTEEFDTDGTVFGSIAYTYSQTTSLMIANNGTDFIIYCSTGGTYPNYSTGTASGTIPFETALGSGEIYEIAYSITMLSTGINSSSYDPGGSVRASGNVTITNGTGTFVYDNGWEWTLANNYVDTTPRVFTKTVTGSNLSSTLNGMAYSMTVSSQSGNTGSVNMKVNYGSATIKRRVPVANSSTPVNTRTLTSYDYSLTSAQVLATGTLNWIAIGQ